MSNVLKRDDRTLENKFIVGDENSHQEIQVRQLLALFEQSLSYSSSFFNFKFRDAVNKITKPQVLKG